MSAVAINYQEVTVKLIFNIADYTRTKQLSTVATPQVNYSMHFKYKYYFSFKYY